MKKTIIMFVIAALIAYAIDWLVRKVKSIIRYRRIQRRIDASWDYLKSDEYKQTVEKFARETLDKMELEGDFSDFSD